MRFIKLSPKARRLADDIVGVDVIKEEDNTWIVHWLLGDDNVVVKSDKFTSCVKANEYIDQIDGEIEDYFANKIIKGIDDD